MQTEEFSLALTTLQKSLASELARSKKLEAALWEIEFLATNHGGWFEQDPFGEYVRLGKIACNAVAKKTKNSS